MLHWFPIKVQNPKLAVNLQNLEQKSKPNKKNKFIGIIGTRRRDTEEDWLLTFKAFVDIYEEGDIIVSGGCPQGGDRFAKMIHEKYYIPYLEFPANWPRFGKRAGFIRNTDIALWSNYLIACVAEDRKGGTEDTINKFLDFYNKPKENLILV